MGGCGGFFFWCEWMDGEGVWKEGEKRGVLGWLLLLLLLLRVGIARIIILMTIIIRVHDISYIVQCWAR